MDNSNFNFPSREFLESNFKKIMAELESLRKQLAGNRINSSSGKIHYYRNKDLREIFKLSDNTIYDYRTKGIIPCTKIGEIYYYPVAEINKILDNNANFGKLNT